jgi:hypothetical protein
MENMKNWQIMAVLTFLIIGIVSLSGCAAPPTSSSSTTPTPQIVYETVTVTQAPVAATSTATSAPQTTVHLTGTSDDVQSFTTTGTGIKIFTMQYSGERNFAVTLYDSSEDYVDLLANETGSYSGKKTANLSTGEYILIITASGPWTIDISSA